MSFKAVQLIAPSQLRFIDVEPQPLKENEIRVQVAVAGVCGSDLKNILAPVMTPQIPGHEFSGSIIEVGRHLKGKFVRDERVTAFPMFGCLKCKACVFKNYRDCADKKSLGFQLPGAFAQEVIIDGTFIIRLKDEITYEQGALLEPFCCGYRLMKEMEKDFSCPQDKHIVIVGDGPIALADLQALQSQSFKHITIIGKHSNRMGIAQRLNAHVIQFSDNYLKELRKLGGIDVCIMAAMAQEVLRDIIPLMNKGAIVYPQTRVNDKDILKQMSERNICLGRAFAYFMDDFDQVMNLMADKRINTDIMVTKRIALSEVAGSFEHLFSKSDQMKLLMVNTDFRMEKF